MVAKPCVERLALPQMAAPARVTYWPGSGLGPPRWLRRSRLTADCVGEALASCADTRVSGAGPRGGCLLGACRRQATHCGHLPKVQSGKNEPSPWEI